MIRSQLISLMKCLRKDELKDFRDFLDSPFHNKSPLLKKLANVCLADYPDFSEKKLEKERVYQKIFPKTEYRDYTMRTLMSKLKDLTEQFIVWKDFQQDARMRDRVLCDSLRDRGERAAFERKIRVLRKSAEDIKQKDEQLLYHQFRLSEIDYTALRGTSNRSTEDELEGVIESLDAFYLANKLKFACSAGTAATVLNRNYRLYLMDELIEFMDKDSYFRDSYSIVDLYYRLYRMQTKDSVEDYREVKRILVEKGASIPLVDLRNGYVVCINFTNKKKTIGEEGFALELFDLYAGFFDQVLIEQGAVLVHHVKNVVTIALEVKKYDWTREFVQRAGDYVEPSYREGVVAYNAANLHFHLGEFDEVITKLFEVEFIDIYYNIDYRKLLIKTYYELDELDALESSINSFDQYLRNNKKLSDVNQRSYLEFVSAMKKILRIIYGGRKSPKALAKEFTEAKLIRDREWLLEKVSLLKN